MGIDRLGERRSDLRRLAFRNDSFSNDCTISTNTLKQSAATAVTT